MAHPWVFEGSPDAGSSGWDSETDDDGILSVAHYTTLARMGVRSAAPYQGAYAYRIRATGGTNPAYYEEADINIAANTTNWFRFPLLFGEDFTGTANDTFDILHLLATGTVEVCFGARIVASTGVINLGIGETAPTSFTGQSIERGKHYTVELKVDVDAGGGDGTIDLYLTKEGEPSTTNVAATQVGSLSQGAITDGRYGLQNHLATTTGTILLGRFIQDDAQIYPEERFPYQRTFTSSGHAFVGRGSIDSAALLSTTSGNIMRLFDSDRANADEGQGFVVELDLTSHTATAVPLHFYKGCYVQMTGTNPRGQVTICRGPEGPRHYFSTALIRDLGRSVRPT